jgi:hypothetical protein
MIRVTGILGVTVTELLLLLNCGQEGKSWMRDK